MGAFEKCCCCIPLQVGAIIIGIIQWLGCICQFTQQNTTASIIMNIISIIVIAIMVFGAVQVILCSKLFFEEYVELDFFFLFE